MKRPVHPFPPVHDIVQSIPAGSKFFAKLDAIHGYFQLVLENESSLLTTFLLPTGRYRYLRAPMGLSSDEWCRQSDRAIEGMPFARKTYNPRANGLAESAVKTVKIMLKKCLEQGEDAERALYQWRNLRREHGFSPSQLLFGRRQRMFVPQPGSAYTQVSFEKAAQAKDKHFDAQGTRYDKDKVNLCLCFLLASLSVCRKKKLVNGKLLPPW